MIETFGYHSFVNFIDAPEPAPFLTTIRAVILDFGDVISLPADPKVIQWMAQFFGLTEIRFREIYGSFRLDYDRGVYSRRRVLETHRSRGRARGECRSDRATSESRRSHVGAAES